MQIDRKKNVRLIKRKNYINSANEKLTVRMTTTQQTHTNYKIKQKHQ